MLNQKRIEMKHDQKEIQEVTSKKLKDGNKGKHHKKEPRNALGQMMKKTENREEKVLKNSHCTHWILCQIEGINSTSIEGKLKPIQSTQSRNQLE